MTDGRNRRFPYRRVVASLSRHMVLGGFCLLVLAPVYFIVVNAFKTQREYTGNRFGFPEAPGISSFTAALGDGALLLWLANSTLITVASVTLSTVIAALAAYPLSLMQWKPGKAVVTILVALLVIPPIVLVVPIFELMADLRQLNTYHSVIAIYVGITLPFSTFLLTSFFATIPKPLLEAAHMDGARSWRVFREIVLPLSVPAMVTVGIVQSLWVWNEVLIAVIFLQDQGMRTLMVGLSVFDSRYRHDVPVVMAGMILAAAPMVALYLFGQRFFIRGLTAGGIKG